MSRVKVEDRLLEIRGLKDALAASNEKIIHWQTKYERERDLYDKLDKQLTAERAVSDRLLIAAEIGYDFLKDRMDTAPINNIGQILAEVEAMRKENKE
ncbi:MAG TPA: hypothetical protein VIY48_19510 [Candidatus Paceibacterota bacterium]